jgi:hypothetical protein
MHLSPRVVATVSIAIILSAASLSANPPQGASPVADGADVSAVREAILERHPGWALKDLKAKHIRDLSFYQGGPVYHVVEVLTSDPLDTNPLGPLNIWLGLFKDARFVRFATHEEVQIYLKRYSKRQ